MNSSLSRMLDKQLLAYDQAANDEEKNLKRNVKDSLTEQIFHGDKIYLQKGALAFKPLGMETVLETSDEQRYVAKWNSQTNLAPRTTEENLAMQHQLDFSSAEDFISFPKSKNLDFLLVKEEASPTKSSKAGQKKSNQVSKSSSKDHNYISSVPRSLEKQASKSALKTHGKTSLRQLADESRQVHLGLQKMEQKIQSKSVLTSPSPSVSQKNLKTSMNLHAPGMDYTSSYELQNPHVKFDLNTLLNAPERATRESLKVAPGQTGAETVEGAQPVSKKPNVELLRQPSYKYTQMRQESD